jgi:hypothetical protein
VSAGAHQLPVGGVGDPFALGPRLVVREHSGGCYIFFLRYPLSALCFGTALTRLVDEIVPAIPSITFVLVVPSFDLSRVGSGGFLGGALLLQGFGGL